MIILRWVLGIIAAGLISLGGANLIMHHTGHYDMNHLTAFQYWVVSLLVPSIAFGLFVYWSSLFVPVQKTAAALFVFILCLVFIGYGTWQHYTDNGFLPRQNLIGSIGIFVGLTAGLLISRRLKKTAANTP